MIFISWGLLQGIREYSLRRCVPSFCGISLHISKSDSRNSMTYVIAFCIVIVFSHLSDIGNEYHIFACLHGVCG